MRCHCLAILACFGFLLTMCSRLCGQAGPIATAEPTSKASEPILKPDDDPNTIISKVLTVYEKRRVRLNCGYVKYKQSIQSRQGTPGEFSNEWITEEWFQLP